MYWILHHDNLLQVQAYLLLIFNSLIVNCPPKLRPVPENTESASEGHPLFFLKSFGKGKLVGIAKSNGDLR